MISVIVPVYKVEKYLRRCVDSILAQTFTDFELILVDDGSPDKCGEICDEYAHMDTRIHVIHKENGGLSSARNAGIEVIKGEYLLFVDSDDVIHPATLDSLWQYSKETKSEIIVGNFCRFRSDSELFFEQRNVIRGYEIISGVQAIERLYEERYDAKYVSTCGKLIKRTLFEGVQFPVGRVFEDEFVTYLLYYHANMVTVMEQPFYYYYMNESGITGRLTLDKWFDEYDAQWERINFYQEKGLEDIYHKALLVYLSSAKWDLVSCRKKAEQFDEIRGKRFEQQYKDVLEQAHKEKLLDFLEHYDYYILGKPQYTLCYRLKRVLMKVIESTK